MYLRSEIEPSVIWAYETCGLFSRWEIKYGKLVKTGWCWGEPKISVIQSGVYVGNRQVFEFPLR